MARPYRSARSMVHLNGNLLCAVDVETTGFIAGYHDLVQVAVLPLDSNIRPLEGVLPFYMNLKPHRLDNIDADAMKITRKTLTDLLTNAICPYRAADLFEEWFNNLNLPITNNHHKKIMPLWSNGGFDKSFIMEWLGREHYQHYFHFHERDTQAYALSINDRFCHHAERIPFPKVSVGYLASCFGIVNETAHDALSDCVTTAEIYRRMLLMYEPVNPGAGVVSGPEVCYGRKSPESVEPSFYGVESPMGTDGDGI